MKEPVDALKIHGNFEYACGNILYVLCGFSSSLGSLTQTLVQRQKRKVTKKLQKKQG